jgi:hypothetical protein
LRGEQDLFEAKRSRAALNNMDHGGVWPCT